MLQRSQTMLLSDAVEQCCCAVLLINTVEERTMNVADERMGGTDEYAMTVEAERVEDDCGWADLHPQKPHKLCGTDIAMLLWVLCHEAWVWALLCRTQPGMLRRREAHVTPLREVAARNFTCMKELGEK